MKIAIVGAGTMGSAIGSRLLGKGCTLSFFDPSPDAGGDLLKLGGSRALSPASAARDADFIITSLNNAEIVEKAVFGESGSVHPRRSRRAS